MPVRLLIIALTAGLLSTAAGSATAEELAAVWVPESGAQAVFAAQHPGALLCDEKQRFCRNFYDFCSRWIGNKNSYALKNIRFTSADNSREYSQCADAHEIRVTKAKDSPIYVGTLKYVEKIYRSSGNAPVPGGPETYVVATEVPVTEFFMFIDGQWRY
jgi:hypothetical protein